MRPAVITHEGCVKVRIIDKNKAELRVFGNGGAPVATLELKRSDMLDAANMAFNAYLEMHRLHLLAGGDKTDPIR